MEFHIPIKETTMPTNRENKGKGTKGSNYDLGNQQNSDLASGPGDNAQRGDLGSRQSSDISQGNQSGSDLDSGPDDNLQRGSRQSGTVDRNLQSGGRGSRSGNPSQDDLDDSM
jgi:hypothetical protein